VRAEMDERRQAIAGYRAAGAPTDELEAELGTLEQYRSPR